MEIASTGFGFFTMYQIMFTLVFLIVIGTFVSTGIKSFAQWRKNNNSPRLTVPASVVAKRTDVQRRRRAGNHNNHYHTSTTYYVTFQVESGDRMELQLDGPEYGLLVEGDRGKLSFQGSRFLGFERI